MPYPVFKLTSRVRSRKCGLNTYPANAFFIFSVNVSSTTLLFISNKIILTISYNNYNFLSYFDIKHNVAQLK